MSPARARYAGMTNEFILAYQRKDA